MTDDYPAARLRKFREMLGLEQKELAARIGVNPGSLGFAERGDREPSKGLLSRLFSEFGLSSDWVMHGAGDMIVPTTSFTGRTGKVVAPNRSRPGHGDLSQDGVEYQRVRRFDVSASAGRGRFAPSEEELDSIMFTSAWFSRHGINADLAALIRVEGDSMTPTIRDGALVLVHRAELQVESGHVYAFVLDDEVFVKRLARIDDGPQKRGYLISSDNPAYPPRRLVGRDAEAVFVAGRIRAVLTEL